MSVTGPTKRREVMDRESRREQILQAAIHVFAQRGYRTTSVADIIEEAGVARGTFYLYFPGKQEIFVAIIDHFFDGLRELMKQMNRWPWPPRETRARIKSDVLLWLRHFNQNKELAHLMLREAQAIDEQFEARMLQLQDEIARHRTEQIRALQAAGLFRCDVDFEFLNASFDGIFREIVLRYLVPRDDVDLEWLADQYVQFTLGGCLAV